jgi:hypothetical protein
VVSRGASLSRHAEGAEGRRVAAAGGRGPRDRGRVPRGEHAQALPAREVFDPLRSRAPGHRGARSSLAPARHEVARRALCARDQPCARARGRCSRIATTWRSSPARGRRGISSTTCCRTAGATRRRRNDRRERLGLPVHPLPNRGTIDGASSALVPRLAAMGGSLATVPSRRESSGGGAADVAAARRLAALRAARSERDSGFGRAIARRQRSRSFAPSDCGAREPERPRRARPPEPPPTQSVFSGSGSASS